MCVLPWIKIRLLGFSSSSAAERGTDRWTDAGLKQATITEAVTLKAAAGAATLAAAQAFLTDKNHLLTRSHSVCVHVQWDPVIMTALELGATNVERLEQKRQLCAQFLPVLVF